MVTSYLLRLPRQYMRSVAGFGSTTGSYHLKRAVPRPSDGLLRQILPWVDRASQAYANCEILPADLTGREFLGLLKELRVVFLQDAAILQRLHPRMSLWSHAVFRDPEWPAFASSVLRCEEVEEEPADVRLQAAVPTIAEAVHCSTNKLSSLSTGNKDIILDTMKANQTSLNDRFTGMEAKFTRLETEVSQHRQLPGSLLLKLAEAIKAGVSAVSGNEGPSESTVSDTAPVPAAAAAAASPNIVRSASPRPTGCPEGCPADPVVASMRSVEEVLREWFVGLERAGDGGRRDSLIELDRRFGPKWRYSTQLCTRYFNRKKLILFVQKKALEDGKETAEVAVELDRLGRSPDKLVRLLKKGIDPMAS